MNCRIWTLVLASCFIVTSCSGPIAGDKCPRADRVVLELLGYGQGDVDREGVTLELRLYKSGWAEFHNSRGEIEERFLGTGIVAELELQAETEEFLGAPDIFPQDMPASDAHLETTLLYSDNGRSKSIRAEEYYEGLSQKRSGVYPPSVARLLDRMINLHSFLEDLKERDEQR